MTFGAVSGWSPGRSKLAVSNLVGGGPFQAVLAALLLPSNPLDALALCTCQLRPPALHSCPSLASVTELELYGCSNPEGGLDDGLSALLRNMPQLQRLTLGSCLQNEDEFPESVRTLSGPTSLSLPENGLEDLPEGPCWAGECAAGGRTLGELEPAHDQEPFVECSLHPSS